MTTLTPEIHRMLAEAQRHWTSFVETLQDTPLTYQQRMAICHMKDQQDPDSRVHEFLDDVLIYHTRNEER